MHVPIPAFSAAWAAALVVIVNGSATYRAAARSWRHPVALVVKPGDGMMSGAAVQADLDAGTCLGAAAIAPVDVTAPFVLTADLATWKEIVMGADDPIAAVARGKVKLTRGSLSTLMLHARAARALVACAQQIDTLWP